MRTWPARCDATGLRVAVVVSRFNHPISVRLLEGCVDELQGRGADPEDIHVAWVPGAFELPLAASALAGSGRYAAVVTLGVVIRGGTPHFDYVCRAVTDGVRQAGLESGVPVAFGVLTCEDVDQACARAGEGEANKGREAARAAVEMACLLRTLETSPDAAGSGATPADSGGHQESGGPREPGRRRERGGPREPGGCRGSGGHRESGGRRGESRRRREP